MTTYPIETSGVVSDWLLCVELRKTIKHITDDQDKQPTAHIFLFMCYSS